VGGFSFRKTWRTALEAYASFPFSQRAGLFFVMACALDATERDIVTAHAAKLGIADRLYLTGHVSDLELRWLYRHCRLFFFPSLYQWLGLPLLEALACGAPVVTSNGSSLLECGGDVSRLVDSRKNSDCRPGPWQAPPEADHGP